MLLVDISVAPEKFLCAFRQNISKDVCDLTLLIAYLLLDLLLGVACVLLLTADSVALAANL